MWNVNSYAKPNLDGRILVNCLEFLSSWWVMHWSALRDRLNVRWSDGFSAGLGLAS